jgi:hypothetical protein
MSRLQGRVLHVIVVALTAIAVLGIGKPALAQGGQICRDEGNLTICGDEFRDFKADLGIDGYELAGNITIGLKGQAPTLRVSDASAVPDGHKLKRATFQHVNDRDKSPYGYTDILFGDITFINEPSQRMPIGSGAVNFNGQTYIGVFWVNTKEMYIDTPLAYEWEDVPIYPLELMSQQVLLYNMAFMDHLGLHVLYTDDATTEDRSQFAIEWSVELNRFHAEVTIPKLRLEGFAENPRRPIILRVFMDEKGNYSGTIAGFKLQIAGMTGEAKNIVVKEGELQIGVLEFGRADNPDLPNLDPTNPNLVFKLEGLKYKDGHLALGATVGINDWQVGNAFKLTKQSVGLVVDNVLKTTTILITSTLTFPSGSALTGGGQYPISIQLGAQKIGDNYFTFGKGTLLQNSTPNLNLGPLSFGLPASTALTIDPRRNFMGLEVDKVTLTWNRAFGGKSGVQSNFRLGIDMDRNLVFTVNGGTINVPEIRTGALVTTLAGSVNVFDNTATVSLKGTARLNIPGNSSVAPTAELILRGGKDVCAASTCKKAYELKMSSFELKIAGFTLGLSNPSGTGDGGFTVNQATLKVPTGINSIGGKVNGLTVTGSGDVKVTGGSFELPPLQIGKFSFVGIKGSFVKTQTGSYEFQGAGVMPLPGLDPSGGPQGKKITVNLVVRTTSTGSFTGMGVKVDFNTGTPGIPIGGTGMELLGIAGTFDLNNNTAKIGVSMRAGTIAKIGPLPVATVKANAQLQVNPFMFTANGELSLLIFKVANASMGVGAGQGFNGGAGFNVSFDVNAVVVHGRTFLRVGQITLSNGVKDTRIAAESTWAIGIKKNQFGRLLPPRDLFLQKVSFKGGHFQLKNGTETIGLMATVGCCIFFDATVFVDLRDGVDVDFVNKKDYKLIDSAQVRAAVAAQAQGYVSHHVSAASVLNPDEIVAASLDGSEMVLQEIVPVEITERGAALFGIAYHEGDPVLRLQLPDGTILTEGTVDEIESGFIRNTGTVTEAHEVAFMLKFVEPGIYTLIIDNAPEQYELVSYVLNKAPVLSDVVATCEGAPVEGVTVTCNDVAAGSQVNISWVAGDEDSPDATVRVSYSQILTDGVSIDSTNQTIVAEELPLGAGNVVWQLDEVPTGSYKVIVSVNDGEHAPVEIIAETTINIVDQRAPATPVGLTANPLPGELLVMWTPNTEKDIAGYEIGFGIVDPNQPDDPSRFVYMRDMGPKEVELPSGDVLDAKLWGLTDNEEVYVGIRAYDISGNYSAWSPLLRAIPWPLSPVAWTPVPNGVSGESRAIEIVFDSPLVTDTLPGALQLLAPDGTVIPGRQELIFDVEGEHIVGLHFEPSVPLAVDTVYTAVVKGGEAGIATVDGRRMPVDYTWNFTASTNMTQARAFLPLLSR